MDDAFIFFKKCHGDQTYNDGSPYWVHILRVGLLVEAFTENLDISSEMKRIMVIAAYGHDALEDTPVSESQIRQTFGDESLNFIKDCTQTDTVEAYVQQIMESSELSRIIKLADMLDNYQSIWYRCLDSGVAWMETKVLPVMEPMYEQIISKPFVDHPSGNDLIAKVRVAHDLALKVVEHLGSIEQ